MTPSIGNGVSLSSALREIAPAGEVRDREERESRRAEKFETEAPPPREDPPRRPPERQVDDRQAAEPAPRERVAPKDVVEIDAAPRQVEARQDEPRPTERREPAASQPREISQAPVDRPVETRQAPEVTLSEEFPPPRTTPGDGDLRDVNSRPQLAGDTLLYLTTARFPVPNLVVDQQRANTAYQQAQTASAQASIARVAFADTADQQVSA